MVEVYGAVLAEAGVECRVVGTELAAGFGSALPQSVELWVHRSDLSRATELIERDSRAKGGNSHDRPHQHFPHPTDDPKPPPPPHRREPYVNPDPGA
jgi:hypothetical protein